MLRADLGLDEPHPMQYLSWLGGIVTATSGCPSAAANPILSELLTRLPATLEPAGAALAVMALIVVTAAELLTDPRYPYTRGLVADTPMLRGTER